MDSDHTYTDCDNAIWIKAFELIPAMDLQQPNATITQRVEEFIASQWGLRRLPRGKLHQVYRVINSPRWLVAKIKHGW